MAYTTIEVQDVHVTPYDEDYPTRSTENLNWNLHAQLVNMEDAGPWYMTDQSPSNAERNNLIDWMAGNIERVFEYAQLAVSTYKATGTPAIAEPALNDFQYPSYRQYSRLYDMQFKIFMDCWKVEYMIYYLWKTEDDPLLIKEYLRDLLNAWPLMDTTIELSDETGQSFRVYPSWKNIET